MTISVKRTETARDDGYQHPQYLYKNVTYATPNIQTTVGKIVYIGVLPANCLVGVTEVRINTGFDGLLIVGTSSDTDAFATTADVTAGTTGTYSVDRSYGIAKSTVDVPVFVQLTTGSTVGDADIWVNYKPAR